MDGSHTSLAISVPPRIVLRGKQQQVLDEARAAMAEGHKSVLIFGPTGFGKSVITDAALEAVAAKAKRAWLTCHRSELVDMHSRALTKYGIRHGIIAAGYPEHPDRLVQVVSIATAAARLGRYELPDGIFTDEAHHAVSSTWRRVREACPDAYEIGFSGSPERLDGRGLGESYTKLILGPSTSELIREGWLCDYRLYEGGAADVSGIGSLGGDLNKKELAEATDKPKLIGDVVDNWLRIAAGTQTVGFAVNIAHSRHIVDAFRAAGIDARHMDADTPRDERLRTMVDFEAGNFPVLFNVDLVSEGVDVAGIETVIMGCETQSVRRWLQACGRGFRPLYAPGTDMSTTAGRLAGIAAGAKPYCRIIYHGKNVRDLRLPDAPREWSLDAKKRRPKLAPIEAVKTCPACFLIVPARSRTCHGCGHEFAAETVPPEHTADELVEMSRDPVEVLAEEMAARDFEIQQRRREEHACKSEQELVELGRKRQYKHPGSWARHAWARRGGKVGRRIAEQGVLRV